MEYALQQSDSSLAEMCHRRRRCSHRTPTQENKCPSPGWARSGHEAKLHPSSFPRYERAIGKPEGVFRTDCARRLRFFRVPISGWGGSRDRNVVRGGGGVWTILHIGFLSSLDHRHLKHPHKCILSMTASIRMTGTARRRLAECLGEIRYTNWRTRGHERGH